MFACAYDGAYVCAEKLTQGDMGSEKFTQGHIGAERLTQGKIRRYVHAGLNHARSGSDFGPLHTPWGDLGGTLERKPP